MWVSSTYSGRGGGQPFPPAAENGGALFVPFAKVYNAALGIARVFLAE